MSLPHNFTKENKKVGLNNMAKIKNYTTAIEELEMILTALKSDEISIDNLAAKVERANELLTYCQDLLRRTESVILEKGE